MHPIYTICFNEYVTKESRVYLFMNTGLLVLITTALVIIIGCFCLVFGLDKSKPPKTRRRLFYTALICVFLVWGLITFIMLNPMG